jgi:CrcB protein
VTALLVLLGGALGAPLRYLADRLVDHWLGLAFPWGTLVVNVVGSFLLGLVVAGTDTGATPGWALSLVGVGLCGAVTTFSTFGLQTVSLLEERRYGAALGNVALSLALAGAACAAGYSLVASA